MNLGAGRIVNQEITRIDLAIEDGSIFRNEVLDQRRTACTQCAAAFDGVIF